VGVLSNFGAGASASSEDDLSSINEKREFREMCEGYSPGSALVSVLEMPARVLVESPAELAALNLLIGVSTKIFPLPQQTEAAFTPVTSSPAHLFQHSYRRHVSTTIDCLLRLAIDLAEGMAKSINGS
jgi:hypothetical protein